MGRLPMVECACHAAAMDWSARPICSIAATNPTVLAPLPPHFSGTSRPSNPASPIRCKTSTGQRSAAQAAAAAGATSRSASVAASPARAASSSVSSKSMTPSCTDQSDEIKRAGQPADPGGPADGHLGSRFPWCAARPSARSGPANAAAIAAISWSSAGSR